VQGGGDGFVEKIDVTRFGGKNKAKTGKQKEKKKSLLRKEKGKEGGEDYGRKDSHKNKKKTPPA